LEPSLPSLGSFHGGLCTGREMKAQKHSLQRKMYREGEGREMKAQMHSLQRKMKFILKYAF